MEDCSAAIILRIAELSIFNTLARHHLLSNVKRYLRFRDDVSVHIVGAPDDICKVICTGYPEDIIFNMETKIIQGKFLNIGILNFPSFANPFTTVLRKQNNKYNIILMSPGNIKKWQEMDIFVLHKLTAPLQEKETTSIEL